MSMFNDIDWKRKENERICISNSEKSQGIREKILAGTLDVSRSWRRKEVQWNSSSYTWRKMRLYSHSNNGTIERCRSSSIQECQCFESWNPEKEKQQRHHALQCGCFQHRSLVPNHSFWKLAQYLRSSFELVWTIRLRKGTRKTERLLDQRCIDKSENTRSKNFGIFSKISLCKAVRGKNIQDFESLFETTRFIRVCELVSFWYRVSAGMRYKTRPDDDDGFWQIISLCREYTLKPTIQSLCSNSRKNNYWTSHWSSDVKILDQYGLEIAIPSRNGPPMLWFL